MRLTRREMTVGDACSLTFLLLMADAVVLVEQIGQMVSKLIGRVPATGSASIYFNGSHEKALKCTVPVYAPY